MPAFNTCLLLPGYHTARRRCKWCAIHHSLLSALYCKLALSGFHCGNSVQDARKFTETSQKLVRSDLVLVDNGVSIMGLVELPTELFSGAYQPPNSLNSIPI
jgi:hypothetical protein